MLIAFASDYGLTDEFVGVCKAVMLGLAPDARILDVSHEIPAHDVRAGALLLVRAVQYLPDDCVVVAVVDPGVGTERGDSSASRSAAACCSGPTTACSHQRWRWPAAPARVVSLDNTEYHLPVAGPDLRRARHPRARGRPPRGRRPARRAREPGRPVGARARTGVAA